MKENLIVHKYRPKTLDDIILLPRIRKYFEDGKVSNNFIFYGHYGTGKTSLSRILGGKYSKDKPYMELNSSYYTSIDTLRTEIDSFCSTVYLPFDIDGGNYDNEFKYLFLDEYEKTSPAAQEAFKAYIEKYETSVRFLLTTNNINKINAGIRSRLTAINFDCQTNEEVKYLRNAYGKMILEVIAPAENISISKDTISGLLNRNFPDYRAMLKELDNYKITGSLTGSILNVDSKIKLDLYTKIIMGDNVSYDEVYHFLMDYVGPDNMHILFDMLGNKFVQWVMDEGHDTNKLFDSNYVITDYAKLLETQTDPLLLGMTIIGKLRTIWKGKH